MSGRTLGIDEKSRLLRELVKKRKPTAVIGAFSPITAMMAEEAGFEVVYLSGAAYSASLGLPDLGLLTLSEVASMTKHLCNATSLPLMVDADTGFGGTLNVVRAVGELEAAGASGIQLEDQEMPKKCGHLSGKILVPVNDMVAKIRAAVEARRRGDTLIVARTDARAVEGLKGARSRAKAYLDAGADVIFPEALESEQEFRKFAEGFDAPLLANMTEFGRTPVISVERFAELGYTLILYPVTLLRVALAAVEEALKTLRAEGSQTSLIRKMMSRDRLYQLMGYRRYEEMDARLAEESSRITGDV